ncbi:winged helix-turn-helix transcriptional regulator [Nocardia crassostreae]|uniref:winged helix-turn-helix transcriptional regulator n=1 Tax=Nocardia crassostreae TaxID=53428 RepID=UPI001FE16836|nr:helix-turn-helix domain-containing protein [Nocardia crassostreae]
MTEEGTSTRVPNMNVRAVEEISAPIGAEAAICQLRDVLDRVGDKWSVLVMALLGDGPRRYSQLQRSIDGISQRMLTLTLRSLERDGLVTRAVTPTSPPRVDYRLTAVGETLSTQVNSLIDWADSHREYVARSRQRYDADRAAEAVSGE